MAVVIGSGIGGSAVALLLAHAGIPTTLIEKNRRVGGSCSGYDKQGFSIDIGTHMFCRGPVGPLNVGVGCVAFAMLGGLAAFLAFGFVQVGLGAIRQAMTPSDPRAVNR